MIDFMWALRRFYQKYLLALCFFLSFFTSHALENDVLYDLEELTACDSLYCPSERGSATEALESFAEDMGFPRPVDRGVQRVRESISVIEAEFRRERSRFSGLRNGSDVQGAARDGSLARGFAQQGIGPTGQAQPQGIPPRQNANQNQRRGAMGAPTNQGAGGGMSGFQPQGQGVSLQQGQVRAGGFLYSDENRRSGPSQGFSQQKQNPQMVRNQVHQSGANQAVQENRRNHGLSGQDQGSRADRQVAALPMAAGQQGPYGQFDSSGASRSAAGGSNTQGANDGGTLKRIAKGLGLDRFFGSRGGGSQSAKQGQAQSGQSGRTSGKNSKNQVSEQKLLDPKTILQRQMDRYNERRLANSPEFGNSDTSIFRSMCQHYIRYAKRHQIAHLPQSHCPR